MNKKNQKNDKIKILEKIKNENFKKNKTKIKDNLIVRWKK